MSEVSIILPTYNRGYCISRSIQSVLSQTFTDFELIVIDDGSVDNTAEIIQNFKDQRIKYIRHSDRKGANVARNIGIKHATGVFVTFQDSDNEWYPQKLEIQVSVLKSNRGHASVVFSGFHKNQNKSVTYVPKPKLGIKQGCHDFYIKLLNGNFIDMATIMAERRILMDAGLLDESLKRFQDWDLALRLSKLSQFVFVNKALVKANVMQDSISADMETFMKSNAAIIEKYKSDYRLHPLAFLRLILNVAFFLFFRKRYTQGAKFLAESISVVFER